MKGSVYALPKSDQALEDFHWLTREIIESGGEASVCEASFIEGMTNDELIHLFVKTREAEYRELIEEINGLKGDLGKSERNGDNTIFEFTVRLGKVRQRLTEIRAIDFFPGAVGSKVEILVSEMEEQIRKAPIRKLKPSPGKYSGRTWVTRRGVHIDRIAAAWLIRRFIDNKARFKFVAAKGYRAERDELRFDMFDAEFTHEGEHCTFEVLIERMDLKDRALLPIAEMVHDIDLKESKFARPETAGFGLMINALCTAHPEDTVRIERAAAILDDLYEFYRRR